MNIHLQRLIAGSKAIATVLLATAGIMVGVMLLSWVIKSLPVVALLILVVLGAAYFLGYLLEEFGDWDDYLY